METEIFNSSIYKLVYFFINRACLIVLTTGIEIQLLKPMIFTNNKIFYGKIMRKFWKKNIVLMNIHEYANELICIFW